MLQPQSRQQEWSQQLQKQVELMPAEIVDLARPRLLERITTRSAQQVAQPSQSTDRIAGRFFASSSAVAAPHAQAGSSLTTASLRRPTEPIAAPQQLLGLTAVATQEPVAMKANGLGRTHLGSPAMMPTLLASPMRPHYFEAKAPQHQQRQVSTAWMSSTR